jgi:hypothetical protein
VESFWNSIKVLRCNRKVRYNMAQFLFSDKKQIQGMLWGKNKNFFKILNDTRAIKQIGIFTP